MRTFPHGFVLMGSACCGIPQSPSAPAPFSKGACGQWPLTISHDSFQRFVTSLTRPVSLPSKMRNENMGAVHALTAAARRPSSARYRRLAKAPLAKGGWFGEAKPGGFRGQGHGLIHYSLFTLHLKCPSPFHMGLCLWEVPAVNPSVAFGASSL